MKRNHGPIAPECLVEIKFKVLQSTIAVIAVWSLIIDEIFQHKLSNKMAKKK
jgi:hypothetical protein